MTDHNKALHNDVTSSCDNPDANLMVDWNELKINVESRLRVGLRIRVSANDRSPAAINWHSPLRTARRTGTPGVDSLLNGGGCIDTDRERDTRLSTKDMNIQRGINLVYEEIDRVERFRCRYPAARENRKPRGTFGVPPRTTGRRVRSSLSIRVPPSLALFLCSPDIRYLQRLCYFPTYNWYKVRGCVSFKSLVLN